MNIPEKFFNEMKKKKVAFIGIGVSNKDVIKMFAEKGIETEARDKASREKLGAAALGDIGSHFPDTDPQWKDVDSTELLAAVTKEVRAAGYRIGNVDATVICERPKLRPCIELIRERLASVMSVGKGRVSVKGKTNEKMDDVGAGVGISVHAVCLLEEARI